MSDTPESVWCLVANIKEYPYREKNPHDDRKGTRHFSPGTNCYVHDSLWGDGFKQVKVFAKHRSNSHNIEVVMSSAYLENWRIEQVFDPYLIKFFVRWYEDPPTPEWTEEEAGRVAAMMNERNLGDGCKPPGPAA